MNVTYEMNEASVSTPHWETRSNRSKLVVLVNLGCVGQLVGAQGLIRRQAREGTSALSVTGTNRSNRSDVGPSVKIGPTYRKSQMKGTAYLR
jgi:hypothetical protein